MPWIWLDEKKYPEFQKNLFNVLGDCENLDTDKYNYCVADIKKTVELSGKTATSFAFRVSADTLTQLGNLTEAYLTTQLERGFSTLDFYKSLTHLGENHV